MNNTSTLAALIISGFLLLPCPGQAGEWGLGSAVAHMQQPLKGVESESLGLPYMSYHGEHLDFELSTLSYMLVKAGAVKLSVMGELRFDGYEPDDSPALAGMEKRDSSFDAGLAVSHSAHWGELKAMYLGDITSTHEGYEARVEYQYPWMVGRLMIAPSIGVSRLDKSLVDYYYGVRINEATASRPYFKGRATSNTYFDIAVVYMLSDSLEWLGGVNYMLLGKNIEASPIVEQGHNVNAFTALMYKF